MYYYIQSISSQEYDKSSIVFCQEEMLWRRPIIGSLYHMHSSLRYARYGGVAA